MALSVTSAFVGDAYTAILRAAIQKAETLDRGLVAVHTGFNKKLHFPKIVLSGNILQDYDPTGVDSGAVGTYTYTDSTAITLQAQSVKMNNIDPNDFRDVFEPFQLAPETLYTFPDLPSEIQQAFMLELLETLDWTLEQNLWQGSRASGVAYPLNRFNGWLTLLDTAADFQDATTSGAVAFTAANIFTYMDAVYDTLYSNATMKAVESRFGPQLKIFVSKTTATLINTAESNVSGKGQTRLTNNGIYGQQYNGIDVVPLAAFPDDQILLTYASNNPRASNLQFGATNVRDTDNVQVARMSNLSNYVGMRMDMSLGCVVPYTTQCIRFIVP